MENREPNKTRTYEINWERVKGWLCFGVAVCATGAAIYCRHEMKKSIRLLNRAADSVKDLTVIEVRQEIVDRAINKAANQEVGNVVRRTVQSMNDRIADQTRKRVNEVVKENYSKIRNTVAQAIAKEATQIDRSDIMDEATEKAKEMLLEKFDGKLDGLLSDYQRNLDNVGKIYQSIASKMAGDTDKNVTLKI